MPSSPRAYRRAGASTRPAAEGEEDRAEDAQARPQVVEADRLLHVEERERHEDRERDRLLQDLQLVETQLNDTGAVLNVYERKGELRYGEVEVGQETALFDPDTSRR